MNEADNEVLIKKYIERIREFRSNIVDKKKNNDEYALNSQLFQFTSDTSHDNYISVLDKVNTETKNIVIDYFLELINSINSKNIKIIPNTPIITLLCKEKNEIILYYFKRYGFLSKQDEYYLNELSKKFNPSNVKWVSLTIGNPHSYVFNVKEVKNEMPLKEFFTTLFCENNYYDFLDLANKFTKQVKEVIGYSIIKPLTKDTMYNFKNYVLSYVFSDEFQKTIQDFYKDCEYNDFKSEKNLLDLFFNNEYYLCLINNTVFSQSIISAEWMYQSMKNTNYIDYTSISLGYFKALEQFLYEFIKTHSGEERLIKKFYHPNVKKDKIYLNDQSINNGWINTTMDSLITFINDYHDLFRSEINNNTRNHVIKVLNKARKLRNGYFHKDNMSEWKIVEESRAITYLAIYYLLSSLNIGEKQKKVFKLPLSPTLDAYKLCNYINIIKRTSVITFVYYIGYGEELKFISTPSANDSKFIDEYGNTRFSKLYVNKLKYIDVNAKVIDLKSLILNENNFIKIQLDVDDSKLIIYEGVIEYCERGMKLSGPQKLIYKNNRFYAKEYKEISGF